MPAAQKKTQFQEEEYQTPIIISSTVEEPFPQSTKIVRICWNTGEEKNCPSCYLKKGCKASS
jgi:hypothetical protein